MKIGPLNPEKESPEMAGSRKRLEQQKEELIAARAEIGRLADLARKQDRVELGRPVASQETGDIYSRREIENRSNETGTKDKTTLNEQRRQEIRGKIESGFYDSDEVKSSIINRMLGLDETNPTEE